MKLFFCSKISHQPTLVRVAYASGGEKVPESTSEKISKKEAYQNPRELTNKAKNKGERMMLKAKAFLSEDEETEADVLKKELKIAKLVTQKEISQKYRSTENSPGLGTIRVTFEEKFFKKFPEEKLKRLFEIMPNPTQEETTFFTLETQNYSYKAIYNVPLEVVDWSEEKKGVKGSLENS